MYIIENDKNKSFRSENSRQEEKKANIPILFENRENCCGCSACYAICPVHAITMEADREGFLYPIIDTVKCIRCYRCKSICVFKVDQNARGYLKGGTI